MREDDKSAERPTRSGAEGAAKVDDNALAGFDLAAWHPPPPPPGLPDGVVARMRAVAHIAAVDARKRSHRRWFALGGVLAAVAAVIAIATWGLVRAPRDGHGDVVATRAQRIDLDGTSVDLDPSAELHWRREGTRITATQRGTAQWTVGAGDRLELDVAVASIHSEPGASLRVEVQMNLSDARVIGASALTAAAVAMVTVVVYEGHVRATSGGQTVNVAPGGAVELRPGQAPSEPPVVGGANPEIQRLEAALRAAQAQIEQLKLSIGGMPDDKASLVMECKDDRATQRWQDLLTCAAKLEPLAADEAKQFRATALAEQEALVAFGELEDAVAAGDRKRAAIVAAKIPSDSVYAEPARARLAQLTDKQPAKGKLDADDIEHMAQAAHGKFLECDTMQFAGKVMVTIEVAPKGTVTKADLSGGTSSLQACIREVLLVQHLKASSSGGMFRFSITFDAPSTDACATMDIDDMLKQAANQFGAGYARAALLLVQKALVCKTDLKMLRMAGLYACRAHDAKAAKQYYARLPSQYQPMIEQACIQETPPIHLP